MPPLITLAIAFLLQAAPVPAPVIDNERVTVTRVTLRPGQSAEGSRGDDSVIIYVTGVTLQTPQGTVRRTAGEVAYHPRGPRVREEVIGDAGEAVVIALHRVPAAPLRNTSGYPEAFPRPGARKLLENDRVVMWDYTFVPGRPSPMHFHSRDTVVLYTDDGAVTSTTPDGVSTVAEHPPGHITFNRGNRTHTEAVTRGRVHIIVAELK